MSIESPTQAVLHGHHVYIEKIFLIYNLIIYLFICIEQIKKMLILKHLMIKHKKIGWENTKLFLFSKIGHLCNVIGATSFFCFLALQMVLFDIH